MKANLKRFLAAILALTMTAALCAVSLPAAAKTAGLVDVIANGDFESGEISPWTTNSDTAIADVGHNSSKSLRLLGLSYYSSAAKQTGIPLVPNTDYTLSFWVKGDPDTEGSKPYCAYVFFDKDNKAGDKWFNKTADWTECELTFNSGEHTECFINITCSGSPDGDAIFLDDVSLTYMVTEPDPDNRLVKNGDFETGSADPWIVYDQTAISTESHGGSYGLCLSATGSYGKAARQTGITVEANTDYVFTFWAKGATGTTGTKGYHAGVYATSGSTKIDSLYFNVTADWKEYTINFNTGDYTDIYLNFSASSSPDGAEVIIDDLALEKVEEPDTALIKNGGFEAATVSPWLLYADSAVVSDAHSGSQALRVLASSGSYAKAARQEAIPLEANTDYVLTFWSKGDPENVGAKGYHAYVFADSSNRLAANSVAYDAEWKLYTIEFNSGDFTSCFVQFSTGSSPDGSAIIVDDFLLEKAVVTDDALIKNGGFETGKADPWVINSSSSVVTDAHEGSYALRALSAGSYASAAKQDNVAYEPNTAYILSFWAKGDPNNPGSKGYHAYVVGGSDYHNQLASNTITLTSDWTEYTLEFNSGEYTFGYVNFSCGSSPDGGAILIDDVKLEVAPENTDGAIKNPGFETGKVDPWIIYNDSALSTDAHEGSYALLVSSNSYYAKAARQNDIPVEPHTNYVLSFWAKGDPNSTGAKMYHAYVFGASDSTKLIDTGVDITAGWMQYTAEFNSGDYSSVYVHFSCGSSPDGSAIIVDDFDLQVAVDTSLLKNGDFEAATFDPWTVYADATITADAHGGAQAARLYATGSYGKVIRQTNITLEPNTEYVLSFWAKGDPNTAGSKGYHAYIMASDGSTKLNTNTITVSEDWVFYTLNFNSGDFTSCYVQFSAGGSPDGSAIIVDDVALEVPPEEIFITNGGFEEGTSPWVLGTGSSWSDVPHEGEHSLRIYGETYYASVAKQTGLRLKKNSDYILIFWAKYDASAGGTKGYHAYVFGDKEKLASNSISLTDDWRRYMLAFNTSDYEDFYVNFSAGSSPDGSALYIDDGSIIPRDGSGYFGEYPEQLVEGADIRIVSFNVLVAQEDFSWSPWVIGERPDKFKAFIEFYKPDVVGLQECSEKWHDGIKEKLGDTYEFLNPDFGGQADMNCSPIIYNKTTVRVIASEVYSYTIGNSPRFRLIDIGVFERISDGARFIVSSTHLDPGWEGSDGGDKTYERNVQAGELVQKAREYIETWNCPYISTGDMNCPAGDIPYNTIVNSGVLTDADPHPQAGVVDHIFISEGAESLYTARVTDTDLQGTSDHYPLIADIKLTGMPQITGIEVSVLPAKLSYVEGKEDLDLTGGRIALTYDNGSAKEIDLTEDMVSGFDNSVVGPQTLTVAYGGFTVTFEIEIVSRIVPGDVDGDEEVTVADALASLRAAIGLTQLEGDALAAADVDGDGAVTVSDALRILRKAAGLE